MPLVMLRAGLSAGVLFGVVAAFAGQSAPL